MAIGDRYFADGGLEDNNPSFAVFYHYRRAERKKSTKRTRSTSPTAPAYSPHGDLDFSRVRFTNIGTGTKMNEVEPQTSKRYRLASLVPGAIRHAFFLKQALTEIAVNSGRVVAFMEALGSVDEDNLVYERFDASHGVASIKLDNHRTLPQIRKKTEQYLEEQRTKDLLEEVASGIAHDYHQSQINAVNSTRPSSLALKATCPSLEADDSTPTTSQLSSGHSNHSKIPASETNVLFPGHDSSSQEKPPLAPLHSVETPNSTDIQLHTKYSQEDSGIDTTEPQAIERTVTA